MVPRRRPARRPRRKAPKRRVPRAPAVGVRGPSNKHFNYQFKLEPQLLVASSTVPGSISIVVGGGITPLQPAAGVNVSFFPAATGLTNYYDVGLSTGFKLEDTANFLKFAALYDAYKITRVTCTVEPMANIASGGGGEVMSTCYQAFDQDSTALPSNIKSLTQLASHKRIVFGSDKKNKMTYSFKPAIAMATQNVVVPPGPTPLQTTSVVMPAQWLDCIQSQTEHYGWKCWLTDVYLPGLTSNATGFRIIWKYNISFRAPLANC